MSRITECNDGEDNNNNDLIDLFDYGCVTGDSPSESLPDGEPVPACADGLDNDEDGQADYPDDAECTGAGDLVEELLCSDYDPVIVGQVEHLQILEPNPTVQRCWLLPRKVQDLQVELQDAQVLSRPCWDSMDPVSSVSQPWSTICMSVVLVLWSAAFVSSFCVLRHRHPRGSRA